MFRPMHPFAEPYQHGGDCSHRGGLYGELACMVPEADHPTACGVDLDPTEPGHYICDDVSGLPHHDCGYHHSPDWSCKDTWEAMAADEALMRYAR